MTQYTLELVIAPWLILTPKPEKSGVLSTILQTTEIIGARNDSIRTPVILLQLKKICLWLWNRSKICFVSGQRKNRFLMWSHWEVKELGPFFPVDIYLRINVLLFPLSVVSRLPVSTDDTQSRGCRWKPITSHNTLYRLLSSGQSSWESFAKCLHPLQSPADMLPLRLPTKIGSLLFLLEEERKDVNLFSFRAVAL